MAAYQPRATSQRAGPALRYCMVVHGEYPLGETRVQREAQTLVDDGFDVDVICLRQGDEPRSEIVAGIQIYRLPLRRPTAS